METPTVGAFLRREPLISFSTASQGKRNKKAAHLESVCLKICTKDKKDRALQFLPQEFIRHVFQIPLHALFSQNRLRTTSEQEYQ
jgi:hypothetical protein